MKVIIETSRSLASYQFKDDNDNVVLFENLSRLEQTRILNGFIDGYELFVDVLKED